LVMASLSITSLLRRSGKKPWAAVHRPGFFLLSVLQKGKPQEGD
jgi:hypothetical protein